MFLDTARQRGFRVQGTEISEYAAEYTRQHFRVPVFLGELVGAGFLPASFDVVTLWDVLEHVQRPSAMLQEANRVLRTTGVLIVRTPNEDTLLNRIAQGVYVLSAGQVRGLVQRMHEYYHLYFFTHSTLDAMLKRCGFRVASCWGGEVHLSRVSASRIVKMGVSMLYRFQALLGMQYEQVVMAVKEHPADKAGAR